MIHNAVSSVANRLDEFIRNKLSLSEKTVTINSLVDINGKVNPEVENKITITLVNLEEEKISKNANLQRNAGMNAPVSINLYLMFSAYFPNFNYEESLRYISIVIEFFQSNNNFDSSNTPGLSPDIEKLYFELSNTSLDDIHKIWGINGSKYTPSVTYKVRKVTFDGKAMAGIFPPVHGIK